MFLLIVYISLLIPFPFTHFVHLITEFASQFIIPALGSSVDLLQMTFFFAKFLFFRRGFIF